MHLPEMANGAGEFVAVCTDGKQAHHCIAA